MSAGGGGDELHRCVNNGLILDCVQQIYRRFNVVNAVHWRRHMTRRVGYEYHVLCHQFTNISVCIALFFFLPLSTYMVEYHTHR